MYKKNYTVRWADMDANIHMRHSAYNDYAAQTRLMFMADNGFGMDWFREHNVYPILFREETVFMKEIKGNENFSIDVSLHRMSNDGSRWSIVNRFFREDGALAAKLTVDGAWMDLIKRKLTIPPTELMELFNKLDKTDDFEWVIRETK